MRERIEPQTGDGDDGHREDVTGHPYGPRAVAFLGRCSASAPGRLSVSSNCCHRVHVLGLLLPHALLQRVALAFVQEDEARQAPG